MLQNKNVLIFLWLLILFFIGFLFLKNNDSRENEAVLRSTELMKNYEKDFFDNIEYRLENTILDCGNDPRDRKILERLKENKNFIDSLDRIEKLEWSALLSQLIKSPRDSIYSYHLIDSSLNYSKSDLKTIFPIYQNLFYHYFVGSSDNARSRVGCFHGNKFGDYLRLGVLDSTFYLTASTPIYTNFIIEPYFDKPKYYSTNFIFNKDSIIRFQAITSTFINGDKIERTKRYEITSTNGQILSPLSYKEIKNDTIPKE